MLKEYISKNLGIKFVMPVKNNETYILCENGVLFSYAEYKSKFQSKEVLQIEFKKREEAGELYDYIYARNTGFLRHKKTVSVIPLKPETEKITPTNVEKEPKAETTKVSKSIFLMCLALTVVSIGSMYISTVHTATYLIDYVDIVSAWLMSAVITIYCSTAFEVIVLFQEQKRYVLSTIFAILWTMVVVFSMTTTVSVFFDRYNFNTIENQNVNSANDGKRLEIELLKQKESDLREAIKEKKIDLEYRREREYATTAVRTELNKLQEDLQSCLSEQREILKVNPNAVKEENKIQKKETFFAFIGRLLHLEGGVLEFIMSTLSAVFINLISPFSVTVVISLLNKKKIKE